MARLNEIFDTSGRAVISAVAGMGGLGKTQLAVRYATLNKAKFPGGVCWLNGQTEDIASQILFKAEFDRQLPGLEAVKARSLSEQRLIAWCWQHWVPDGL